MVIVCEVSMEKNTLDWFRKALAVTPDALKVEVAGAELNLLVWGEQDKPALLFIHGGAAHAGWWRFIAPFFLPDHRCVAVDLSGHGYSEHREYYPPGIWADEILELIDMGGIFSSRPIIIGHSMGGLTGIRVAAEADIPGLIIVDAAVRPPENPPHQRVRRNILGRSRLYSSKQDAVGRFRLIPPQPTINPEIVDFIADSSVRQVVDGWAWLFDPNAFRQLKPVSLFEQLERVTCSVALLRGELSRILDSEAAVKMCGAFGGTATLVDIPQAYHHIMIDQPLELVSVIRTVLAEWG
ncbi:MAG TPA: alpha/beta hydrolase [Gammaproteobacteria bacterium]|nr:alpha/beta hydrolase [Gammaproteobacteria bacterium]